MRFDEIGCALDYYAISSAPAPDTAVQKNTSISKFELGRSWKAVPWRDVLARKPGCKAEYYFMRSGLIRKDLLPLYANADAEKDSLPATFTVTSYEELASVVKEQQVCGDDDHAAAQLWVLKLADSSNAFGMKFFGQSNPSIVKDDMKDKEEKRVIQRYIPPLLLQGRKFHIRTLILAVGDLQVFAYRRNRVLIATEKFDTSCEHVSNKYMHITNRSANEGHPQYDEGAQNLPFDLSLSVISGHQDADESCGEARGVDGLDSTSITRQMRAIVGPLFDRLTRNRRHFFSLPNCYELFGFDFMLDHAGRLWLLEVNPDPSLGMFVYDWEPPPRNGSNSSGSGSGSLISELGAKARFKRSLLRDDKNRSPLEWAHDEQGPEAWPKHFGCLYRSAEERSSSAEHMIKGEGAGAASAESNAKSGSGQDSGGKKVSAEMRKQLGILKMRAAMMRIMKAQQKKEEAIEAIEAAEAEEAEETQAGAREKK